MPFGFEYLLPVGISFFTFQSLSYTIDFYLGNVQRERNLLRFATFVCFFPQLMAGPIERARHLLPQFHQFPPVRLQNFTDGASLFLVGLFQTYRNLFLTFFISGIWHGAAWTFVIWGTLHATGIMITRELERSAFYRERVPRLVKQFGVFLFVCFAWIFFRAGSLEEALLIVTRIFT